MTKKKSKGEDVLDLFTRFKKIMDNKPAADKMAEEVRMMKFRIKPLQGDITAFNFRNPQFIETLWSLGKLDEFFHKEFKKLSASQKGVFFKAFDDLYQRLHHQLNAVNLTVREIAGAAPYMEMEILKELPLRKRTN